MFGPPPLPYGIGLSKVGWIWRGGVGMGVPFLGFNVSYILNLKFGCYTLDDLIFVSKVSIPNLSLLVSLEVA